MIDADLEHRISIAESNLRVMDAKQHPDPLPTLEFSCSK